MCLRGGTSGLDKKKLVTGQRSPGARRRGMARGASLGLGTCAVDGIMSVHDQKKKNSQ